MQHRLVVSGRHIETIYHCIIFQTAEDLSDKFFTFQVQKNIYNITQNNTQT
jgi:hypothetical protein